MERHPINKDQITQVRPMKRLVLNGAFWTFSGYAVAQVLRLTSNVIMAKLLFPEAFGLMTLVMVFIQGISMFSDIGIMPSIIQNKRGDDPDFLDTAWTMQVIRGGILWLITLLGAYPYSVLYQEPLLAYLLPVVGITAILGGFNSTALATANRDINLKNITILDLISQVVSLIVMITWVYLSPSVWGLVAGGVISALVKLVLSHLWIATRRNRFHWDKDAAHSLFRFGRWILFSTALTFFAGQLDKLLLGSILGTGTLGVYTIAVMFKDTAANAIKKIAGSVLFPSYSEIIRSDDQKRLYKVLKKSRLVMILFSWTVALLLILVGSQLIDWLYDERYSDAVWMIQIFPFASFVGVLSSTYQNVFLAKGKSSYISILLIAQITLQFIAIFLGNQLAGLHGIVVGLTMIGWAMYPLNAIVAIRLKIWQPELDIPVIVLASLVTVFYLTTYVL